jgi:hypothetical protein
LTEGVHSPEGAVGLEEAIHEIALEIQRREDSEEGLSADAESLAAE